MKKFISIILSAALILSLAACGNSNASSDEPKKELPLASQSPQQPEATPLYKDIMKPYNEIKHGSRLIVLQNTLVFSREGIYTQEETPVAETIKYNETDYNAYPVSAATRFFTNGLSDNITVYTADGTSQSFAGDDFNAAKVLIDDFQSGNAPILLMPDGKFIENFDYAITENNEGIFSVVSEQEISLLDLFEKYGWDNTKTYNVVATDAFYIPVTEQDYDEGGLRGGLSGAVNASFADMTIAMGKLSDAVFIETIVE